MPKCVWGQWNQGLMFKPVMCLYILDKKVRGKPIAIYNFARIIGKSFSKAFTKHNTEKVFNVTGIYPLNEIGEDEFLSSFVNDRSYQSGKRTTNCTFRFQEQHRYNQSRRIYRKHENISWSNKTVPKDGTQRAEGRQCGRSGILTDTWKK